MKRTPDPAWGGGGGGGIFSVQVSSLPDAKVLHLPAPLASLYKKT